MRKFIFCLLLAGCAASPAPKASMDRHALNVADAALHSGDPGLALKVSQAVLNQDPDSRDAKLHEAAALYAMGRRNAAKSIYEGLYKSEPSAEAAAGLAKCVIHDDPRKAVLLLHVALAHKPRDPAYLTNLGVANDLAGQHKAAQAAYREALDVDPAKVSAQADLALSLAVSGRSDQALTLLKPLAYAQDATPRVRQDYGAVLAMSGDVGQAAKILAIDLPAPEAEQVASAYEQLVQNSGANLLTPSS